ncbi:MAG: DEAD/DEAH box helicase [Campylobacteraceae bacterium]|jgi:transcription-repair coupling factor (superfamily II helicase)|nr:DEAD/DEAH box helicase [Campylobacteraceae bacterium]
MNNIYSFLKAKPVCNVIITADDKESQTTSDICEFLGLEPFVLADFRANYLDDLLPFSTELQQITKTLNQFHEYKKQNKILIAPIRTISLNLPSQKCFASFTLEFGDTINIEEFKSKLFNWGYYFVDIVTSNGEVSVRGDIIDILPLDSETGFRISLFDDEIESIRVFDVENQKSEKEEIESICIHPAFLALDEKNYLSISEKIESSTSDAFVKDIHSLGFWYLDSLSQSYITDNTYITDTGKNQIEESYIFDECRYDRSKIENIPKIENSITCKNILASNPKEFISFHDDKKVTIISNTQANIKANGFELANKNINYLLKPYIINLLDDDEVIISLNKEYKHKKKKKIRLVLDELKPGDFVVHDTHGIAKFEAIEPVVVMGAKKDFAILLYAGDDKLLVPVENIDVIDRYVANGGTSAILDKLGKGSFAKLKSKVKEKLFAIASDIIKVAAARELVDGIKIDTASQELALFQHDAGFEYTKDQTQSVKEIFKDMSSGRVMDRLLSGDVGFGKTEVAMNAIMATALSGHQSLFVAPTTLLSSQHYISLVERFKNKGFYIGKLDGKSTAKEKLEVKKGLEDGTYNIVVGTHSLLNVTCKNLALVIIDEEHKFGVKQKEKLKELANDIHLFSMSATPIPRTLNLAMSKIKGMSRLTTAPRERLGVRTYVKEYDEKSIKEIILREKRRGGQLFYVHNNIASIDAKKADLLEILPNLKIEIIHSKISAVKSEKILDGFNNGDFDILLATSIVESGLHLPNANTIIIDGADRFGIADLHQLRGRVGRSNKEGFCYFVVENKNNITQDAMRRLVALESNSYLGSGQALAYQDLEIRGGGNIIGEAQSGHIKQIGYSLYLKMLEDALATLSGEAEEKKTQVDVKLAISAYISSELISEDRVRLELYRRLSQCEDIEAVYTIEEEIEDRFGKLDINTKQFLQLIMIKIKALNKGIKTISNYEQNISFTFNDDKKEMVKSSSRDDDDIIIAVMKFLG